MKKSLFFASLFIAAFGFTSCEDETNGGSLKIEAKFSNGKDYNGLIDEVRAMIVYKMIAFDEVVDECNYTVAKSKFKGGFKIILPQTIYYDDIYPAIPFLGNYFELSFCAFKNNERVGYFVFCSPDLTYLQRYVYSFGEGGISPWGIGFNKGWNIMYISNIDNQYNASLEKPNANLNWYFIPN